jgi:hypothetical protein
MEHVPTIPNVLFALVAITISWLAGSALVGFVIAVLIVHEFGSIVFVIGAVLVGCFGALAHILIYLLRVFRARNTRMSVPPSHSP